MSHIHCENTREPQNVNTEIIANPSVRTGRRCRARLTILAENMQINSNDFCRQLCSWPLFEKSAKTNDGKIIIYYQRQSTNRGRTPRLITSSIPFGFGVLLMESRPKGLAHRRHLDNCQLEPKDSFGVRPVDNCANLLHHWHFWT